MAPGRGSISRPSSPGAADYEHLYRTYGRLRRRYMASHKNPFIGLQVLHDGTTPRYSRERVERDSFGLSQLVSADWELLSYSAGEFDADTHDTGLSPEHPHDSVYQTALVVARIGLADETNRHGEPRWFYRGQSKDSYITQPKIFRGLSEEDPVGELNPRVNSVARAVTALERAGLGADELTRIAIAQHYSAELGLATWLLDVTLSPWVALWFASAHSSSDSVDGDIGMLEYVERAEYIFFGHGDRAVPGAIREVSPAGVPRIGRQAAFFIEAPNPDLWRHLSNRKLWFRQRQDVTFTDPDVMPAATRADLFPTTDQVLSRLPFEWRSDPPTALSYPPGARDLLPPNEEVYWTIAESWMMGRQDDGQAG